MMRASVQPGGRQSKEETGYTHPLHTARTIPNEERLDTVHEALDGREPDENARSQAWSQAKPGEATGHGAQSRWSRPSASGHAYLAMNRLRISWAAGGGMASLRAISWTPIP